MSALYTALVESETKESLAAMVVDLRAAASKDLPILREDRAALFRGEEVDGRVYDPAAVQILRQYDTAIASLEDALEASDD